METLSELQIVLVRRTESPFLGQNSPSPLDCPPSGVIWPTLVWGTSGRVEDMEGMYPSSSLPRIITKMPLSFFGVEETPYSMHEALKSPSGHQLSRAMNYLGE